MLWLIRLHADVKMRNQREPKVVLNKQTKKKQETLHQQYLWMTAYNSWLT